LVFTDGVSDGKIRSVNIIAKYLRKKYVGVSVCIYQFSGGDHQKVFRGEKMVE
jgi:hypothetical protein